MGETNCGRMHRTPASEKNVCNSLSTFYLKLRKKADILSWNVTTHDGLEMWSSTEK